MAHSQDPYGLKITAEGMAASCWLEGLEMSLSFDNSGISPLSKAIEHDKDFALAHALLARQLAIHGFSQEWQPHLKAATSLVRSVTEREASLIDITESSLTFKPDTKAKTLAHLDKWPTDVIAFSYLVGPFGLLAFSGSHNWRQENVDLFDKYEHQWPENDWWFLTTQGFSLTETRDLKRAEKAVTKAWDIKGNGNCAHALSHYQIECGALEEGQSFLQKWLPKYGPSSDMCHHLHWHSAVIGFAQGSVSEQSIQSLYTEALDPKVSDPMPLSTFSDNASLLWRSVLNGFHMPEKYWQDMWAYAEKHYPFSGFVFADIHKIMLAALSQSPDLYKKLEADFREIPDATTSSLLSSLNQSFWAFTQSNYSMCKQILKPILEDSVLLGGSNPQRNVVIETYEAASKNASKETFINV